MQGCFSEELNQEHFTEFYQSKLEMIPYVLRISEDNKFFIATQQKYNRSF